MYQYILYLKSTVRIHTTSLVEQLVTSNGRLVLRITPQKCHAPKDWQFSLPVTITDIQTHVENTVSVYHIVNNKQPATSFTICIDYSKTMLFTVPAKFKNHSNCHFSLTSHCKYCVPSKSNWVRSLVAMQSLTEQAVRKLSISPFNTCNWRVKGWTDEQMDGRTISPSTFVDGG